MHSSMRGWCKSEVVLCSVVSFCARSAEHCLKATALSPQNRKKVSDKCIHACPLFVFVKCPLYSSDLRIYGTLCLLPFLPAFPTTYHVSLTFSPSHSFSLMAYFPCILSSPCPAAPYSFSLTYLLSFSFLTLPLLLLFFPLLSSLPSSLLLFFPLLSLPFFPLPLPFLTPSFLSSLPLLSLPHFSICI